MGARVGGVLAARPIHAGALRAMLAAPTSFHDITPMGRIVARFSNDMFVVDAKLPELLADIIWIVCKVSRSVLQNLQGLKISCSIFIEFKSLWPVVCNVSKVLQTNIGFARFFVVQTWDLYI
jgi:ABC-type multidrug transport system fused ATPase/permease subunit